MTALSPHLHCLECGFPIDLSDVIAVDATGWTCDLIDGLVIPKRCMNCSHLFRVIRVLGVIRLQRI